MLKKDTGVNNMYDLSRSDSNNFAMKELIIPFAGPRYVELIASALKLQLDDASLTWLLREERTYLKEMERKGSAQYLITRNSASQRKLTRGMKEMTNDTYKGEHYNH